MAQMFAQQAKIIREFREVPPQTAEVLDDLFRPLFNLQTFQAQNDGLEIGVKVLGETGMTRLLKAY